MWCSHDQSLELSLLILVVKVYYLFLLLYLLLGFVLGSYRAGISEDAIMYHVSFMFSADLYWTLMNDFLSNRLNYCTPDV